MSTSKVSAEFKAKFDQWATYMQEVGMLNADDIEETRQNIRQDSVEGPDTLRDPPFDIPTREERMQHWERYFDFWLPAPSGINASIREQIKRERQKAA